MPSLSLNIGLNNGRKLPFGGGAAPSGIPVASTNSVIVTYSGYNRTLSKPGLVSLPGYSVNYGPEGEYDDVLYFNSTNNRWEFPGPYSSNDIGAVNSSTNPNFIPTTGWTPSITITAVSGIPVASTNTVNINIPSYGLDGAFNKGSPESWTGPDGDYYLIFTGTRWEVTAYGDVIAFNESASQTVNYIPQTSWNVTTTITVVS
jgi:hypothetical protein